MIDVGCSRGEERPARDLPELSDQNPNPPDNGQNNANAGNGQQMETSAAVV